MQHPSVDENVVTRGSWEPYAVFPLKADSECAHSVFEATLRTTTTADNKSRLSGDEVFGLTGCSPFPERPLHVPLSRQVP